MIPFQLRHLNEITETLSKGFRKNWPFIFLVSLFTISFSQTEAQPNLVVSKPGSTHHYFYQVGDRITYRNKLSGAKYSGIIISLDDSTFQLARSGRENIVNIETIYRTRHFLSQAAGAGVVVLGVYLPISIINRALQGQSPLIDEDLLIVNGSMLAVSGISFLFLNKKMKIHKPWKVQILDFGHPVY